MRLALILFAFTLQISSLVANQIQSSVLTGVNLVTGTTQSIRLDTFDKKATVVVFFSARCPCSRSLSEEVRRLSTSPEFKDFRFVGIHSNVDETEASDIEYFKSAGFRFPILRDAKAKLANEFGAFKTPHAFVIDSKRKTLYMGAVMDKPEYSPTNQSYLRLALESIRQGKTPEIDKTVSIGCVIRRPS